MPSAARDAGGDGGLGDVGRGLDAEHGDAAGLEVLQQVAVVAGDLDHLVAGVEAEALHHGRHVGAGVVEHRLRVGGEIGVVGVEDRLAPLHRRQLHQEARVADEGVQGVEGLGLQHRLGGQVGVGERRGAEVDEAVLERRPAGAAGERGHGGVSDVWPSL
jgi:hypothetical protein